MRSIIRQSAVQSSVRSKVRAAAVSAAYTRENGEKTVYLLKRRILGHSYPPHCGIAFIYSLYSGMSKSTTCIIKSKISIAQNAVNIS